MTSFATKVIGFNNGLQLQAKLPFGIAVMNPFKESGEVRYISALFYKKFYEDNNPRKLILGINPGRLGAGSTGIPFTDTKRLSDSCGISIDSFRTHEPSSVFIYDVIDKFGGPEKFYNTFYINSVCPLGFIRPNSKGNWVNCNYYDYDELFAIVRDYIIANLKRQVEFGIDTTTCFVLGKKNAKYLRAINEEENIFDNIVALDHPRYIVQYKSRQKDFYIERYLNVLNGS